ncbi:MAG: amino acid permease [Haliscomenobacteraceae bacterium CHB4]|nr:Serine/threonine exchanger SteT [Saprospiraceae bacterium]MCE7922394.1 amino acid permease [Haliscomenobacteraceae bacterium CHB4]
MSHLQKKLSLYGLTMIAVGSCIGSGIFVTPAQIAGAVPNATLVLAVWALGGVIALTGALTFSELGGMFPKSGGVYVYLKEAYGDMVGFLYGWVVLLVINTGALAGLCVAFAEYLKMFFPGISEGAKTAVAAFTMLVLTGINILGVQVSQGLSNLFTGLKLLSIGGIIAAGFIFFDPARVQPDFSLAANVPANLIPAMLTGLIGVLFSVGGWHHASYLAGEAIDAPRTVPRAMFLGVIIVISIYLLVNVAYMLLLPLDVIARTPKVAGDAMATIAPWGGKAVAVAIALSIFGTISIYTMSAPRIYFAMAEDGIFFKQLAYVHPRWRTPVVAMLVQVVWAMLVLLFFQGLFDKIITFVTFMDIAFMGLAGAAIFVFRNKRKDAKRPVKARGYPFIPLIFVVISAAFALNTLFERPEQALPGLGLLLIGVAVFFVLKLGKK